MSHPSATLRHRCNPRKLVPDLPPLIRCSAYQSGHQVHYIQARLLRESDAYRSPTRVDRVEATDDTTLRIRRADGTFLAYRNHQAVRAQAAWEAHPDDVVLYEGKSLLGVRHPTETDGKTYGAEYLFHLAGIDFRSCAELAAYFKGAPWPDPQSPGGTSN